MISERGIRMPKDKIRVYWSKKEGDLMVDWDHEAGQANPRYVLSLFPQEVLDELTNRGYDISTLRFQIRKKD